MPTEIRRKEVRTLVTQGRIQLIDVRPVQEYEQEHLPQAANIPLTTMIGEITKSLQKDRAIVVYSSDSQCDLSARAAWRLEAMGFLEVYRYAGGIADWLAAGWETEGAEARKTRIRQMVQRDVLTCSMRERLQDVKNRRQPNQEVCVVVNDRGIVLGVIQGEAWDKSELSRIADIMQPGPRTIRPHLEPNEARKLLRDHDPAAIVTNSDGELLGIVRIAQRAPEKARDAA